MAGLVRWESLSRQIASLVLDRPQRRNALSVALMRELCEAFESLERDAACRVVILSGNGPVFSAGLDLREAADESLVGQSAVAVERMLMAVRQSSLVTVAAVHGGAFAGGAGLMAACDVVVAADDVQISFPEARRGLLPALICDVLRTRVREGDLRDLLLTGDPIDALRAREIGLVQRVVPPEDVFSAAIQAARSVTAGGPETIRMTKRLLASVFADTPDRSPKSMTQWHQEARRSDEAREGLKAFVERRDPYWAEEEPS